MEVGHAAATPAARHMAVAIDSAGRTTSPTPEAGATRGALIGAIRAAIDGEAAASPTGR